MPRPSLLLPLTLAACATSPQFATHERAGKGQWGERLVVDAVVLPAVWLQFDQEDRLNPGQELADAVGPGAGVRAAIGNQDQSVGLLYMGSWLEDDDTDAERELHALFLDFDVTVPWPDGPPQVSVRAAAGFGAAWLGFGDARFDDVATGAANLRLDCEWAATPRMAVLIGFGGLAFGHPGDTEAFGTFVEFGGRFTF